MRKLISMFIAIAIITNSLNAVNPGRNVRALQGDPASNGIIGVRVVDSSSSVETKKLNYDYQTGVLEYDSQTPGSLMAVIDPVEPFVNGSAYTLTGKLTITSFLQPAQTWYSLGLCYRMNPSIPNQSPALYSGITLWQNGSANQIERYWTDSTKTATDFVEYNPVQSVQVPGNTYDFTLKTTLDEKVIFILNGTTIFNRDISSNDINTQFGFMFSCANVKLEDLNLIKVKSPEQHFTDITVYGDAIEAAKVNFDLNACSLTYNSTTPGSLFAMLETDTELKEGSNYTLTGKIKQTGFAQPVQSWHSSAIIYRFDEPQTGTPPIGHSAFYSAVSLWQNGSANQVELYWANENKTSWDFVEYNPVASVHTPGQTYDFELSVSADRRMVFKLNNIVIFDRRMSHNQLDLKFGFLLNYSTVEITNLNLEIQDVDRGVDGINITQCDNVNERSKITFNVDTGTLEYISTTPTTSIVKLDTCKDVSEGKRYSLTGTMNITGFLNPAESWYNLGLLYRYTPSIGSTPSVYSGITFWNNCSANLVEYYWSNPQRTATEVVQYIPQSNVQTPGEIYDFELIITEYNTLKFYIEDGLIFESDISANDIDEALGFLFLNSTGKISNLILTQLNAQNPNISGINVIPGASPIEDSKATYSKTNGTVTYASTTPGVVIAMLETPLEYKKGITYSLSGTITQTGFTQPEQSWYSTGIIYRLVPADASHQTFYSNVSLWQNGSANQTELYWTDESHTTSDFVEYNPVANAHTPGQSYPFEITVTYDNKMIFTLDNEEIFNQDMTSNDLDIQFGFLFNNSTAVISNLKICERVLVDKAEILSTSGVPELYINNNKVPPVIFTQWLKSIDNPDFEEYPNYAKSGTYAGIKMYQPRLEGVSDVSSWAPYLNRIIESDPDALFILPIWVQSAETLNITDPADLDSSAPGVCSMGSSVWRERAVDYVEVIVNGFMNSQYANRIVGFMPTAGNTGEWFDINTYWNPSPDFDRCQGNIDNFRTWLTAKYVNNTALQSAWDNSTVTLATATIPAKTISQGPFLNPLIYQSLIDYMAYHSYIVATAIDALSQAVKNASGDKRIVGVPYGYSMDLGKFNNVVGSQAFDQLLDTEAIDFICSPLSYQHRDVVDYVGWHGFADSAKSHGKLWLSEDDTVTHLNPQPQYNWYRHITMTPDNSQAILWKNFMAAYTKRMGHWWFDNYGQGSLNSSELMSDVNLMNKLYKNTLDWSYESVTEVALVLDEKSAFYQTPGSYSAAGPTFNDDLLGMRKYLGIAGAPVDVISLEDIRSGNAAEYKVYIFANVFALNATQRTAIDSLKRDGKSLIFIKTPGILNLDNRQPSLTTVASVTGFDLRLAKSDTTTYQQMGYGVVDMANNLTEKSVSTLFTQFSLTSRPHMFAQLRTGETSLLNSTNGKSIVAKSVKSNWTSYFANNMNLLTTQMLRTIYSSAGVFVYSGNDRNVSADNNFASVSVTANGGSESVFLPISNGQVYEITTGTYYTVTNNATTISNVKSHTFVFYLGTQGALENERSAHLCTTPLKIYTNGGKDDIIISQNNSQQIFAYLANRYNYFMNEQPTGFTYLMENSSIATINSSGTITGVAQGETKLTISYNGISTSYNVFVEP